MNYPIWDLPAPGLLIAVVAILHVFVSHFAVGGGLFLVLTEMKARRENDEALLEYLRRHSRFFILLTLVFGAVTGVGIWFTIGLVNPAATSSLINSFVWAWAIEWTFFVTEIAAALVYYYGWNRLTPREHVVVGWVYFVSAWMSLVVINGILTYMLTPGAWIGTHAFRDGFFNPTFWPAAAIRTLGAIGLAGVYAIFTAAWLADNGLRDRLTRYAATRWVLPMAVLLPFTLLWFFSAAGSAGVPVAEIFATKTSGVRDLIAGLFVTATSGQPVAQRALKTATAAALLTGVIAFACMAIRPRNARRFATVVLMLVALATIGGAEWVREDLRKPYVIGSTMFVNAIRVPAPAGSLIATRNIDDMYAIDRTTQSGVLAASRWTDVPAGFREGKVLTVAQEGQVGQEVFHLLCTQCHTTGGYLAMRRLVAGRSVNAIENTIEKLAVPRDAQDREAAWDAPQIQLATWRNRRMPPFAGNEQERHALAVYLTLLGGGNISAESKTAQPTGAQVFENSCSGCHGEGGDIPIAPRVTGRSEVQIYEMLDHLPDLNPAMPDFEGSEDERHALAKYLGDVAKGGR